MSARPDRRRRLAVAAAALPALAATLIAAPSNAAPSSGAPVSTTSPAASSAPGDDRARAYSEAAEAHDVPRDLLLAVSYLESRWDVHAGQPSTTGGFGPMHLTDSGAVTPRAPEPAERRAGTAPAAKPEPMTARDLARDPAANTIRRAAELTGLSKSRLRADPKANIAGGAALLADYQRELDLRASDDPGRWYAAVARYGAPAGQTASAAFADEVFSTLESGQSRTTDDGARLRLPARDVEPVRRQLARLGDGTDAEANTAANDPETDCPSGLGCEWIPAPYEEFGDDDYGNHDKANRPDDLKIDHIVIHDTEETYDRTLDLVQDPKYIAWHYTLRSSDGHVAQHVRTKDVGWHAGAWYTNSSSIGLEHEGYAAEGTWFTEALYRSSAKLVRYLAERYDIPLDRQHIIGHDNVQGMSPDRIAAMHWDPGPYWDWSHYFELLEAPFEPEIPIGGAVTIRPDYDANRPEFIGCEGKDSDEPCQPRPSSSVILRTAPSADAPLLKDVGTHPEGDGRSTMRIEDVGSRVDAGQQFAVAGKRGDWTAIWYLGQKGWFHNPRSEPTAVPAKARVVTPNRGSIPVYGMAYPEKSAYPDEVPVQEMEPLPYQLRPGQRYVVGERMRGTYLYAKTFDPSEHVIVRGRQRYYQIQLGHRLGFVKVQDVARLS